jgi:hypothetical protein
MMMPETNAEGIACMVVLLPFMATAFIMFSMAICHVVKDVWLWQRFMNMLWGNWIPPTEEEFIDNFSSIALFGGVGLILIPIAVVVVYCLYTGQPMDQWIIESWREIRIT